MILYNANGEEVTVTKDQRKILLNTGNFFEEKPDVSSEELPEGEEGEGEDDGTLTDDFPEAFKKAMLPSEPEIQKVEENTVEGSAKRIEIATMSKKQLDKYIEENDIVFPTSAKTMPEKKAYLIENVK